MNAEAKPQVPTTPPSADRLKDEAARVVYNCTGKIEHQWQRKLIERIVALVRHRGGRDD